FLEETSDFDRWKPVLATQSNHSVKTGLNTLQNLRITLENGKDFRVCLLEHANSFCYIFRPVCKARALVWSAEENNTASAVKDLLKMPFRPLLRHRQTLCSLECALCNR